MLSWGRDVTLKEALDMNLARTGAGLGQLGSWERPWTEQVLLLKRKTVREETPVMGHRMDFSDQEEALWEKSFLWGKERESQRWDQCLAWGLSQKALESVIQMQMSGP